MNLRSSLACTSSDIARWGLRSVLKRQGGVLPGRIAMKIDPELLSDLAALVDRSVVITGTNGKTTTSNLIADAVAASGATVVCNRAGNNMEPGVVGALLEARSGLKRAGGKRVGVFECDELYTVRVLPKLKPTYFVLLNLFRDQLDRYGEIDHTQEVIAHALELSPATTLIYNADDPLCAAIAARVPNASIAFGIDGATNTESDRISDSRFCSQCNAPLEYDYVQYGQLGAYHCPSCGWARPALVRRVTGVKLGCDGYGFDLVFGSAPDAAAVHIATRYNGLYMVYNVAAAFFAARELGVDTAFLQPTLDAYVPAGGRMGRWEIAGRTVEANLAKNPVGFDRQIQSIKTAGGRLCAGQRTRWAEGCRCSHGCCPRCNVCRWQCRPRRHRASRAFAPAAHRLPVPRCPQPLRRRRQRYRPRASLRLARHPRSRGRGPYGRVTRSHRCRYRHDGWRLRPRPASRGTRAARPKRQGRILC